MNRHHLSILVLTSTFGWRLLASEGTSPKTPLLVTSKATEDAVSQCESVRTFLLPIIASEGRFVPRTSGPSPLWFDLRCSSKKITGHLWWLPDKSTQILATTYSETVPGSVVSNKNQIKDFWNHFVDHIPWAGEILSMEVAPVQADYQVKPGQPILRGRGITSLGLDANKLLGPCIPIEIGYPKSIPKGSKKDPREPADFHIVYPGLLKDVKQDHSQIEIYSNTENLETNGTYFIRLSDPEHLAIGISEAIAYCQSKQAQSGQANVTNLYSDVFGKDSVEVNNIQQRYGLFLANVKGNNGLKINLAGAAYIHNRLLFGSYFIVDGFGLRSIFTTNSYDQPSSASTKTSATTSSELNPPEMINAEIFAGGRLKIKKFEAFVGLGLVIEKVNLPYSIASDTDPTVSTIQQRLSSTRGGLIVGGNYSFGRFNYGLRLPVAENSSHLYVDFHNYLTYRISSTWLLGADVLIVSAAAKEPHAPSYLTTAIGGSVGIEIGK